MIRSDDRFGLDGWFAGCWPTMTHSTMIQEAINKYLSNGNLSVQRGERPFKVVLFDMDGVLYDSMPHHAIAWQGFYLKIDSQRQKKIVLKLFHC